MLTVKVSNGLAKYNGAATDAVFRRGEHEPTFEITTAVPQADVEVSIFRKGQLVKRLKISMDSGSGDRQSATGSVAWFWDTDLWDDYSKYPVGQYQVRATIRNPDGSIALRSPKQPFYVIFERPQSISEAEEKSYLYNKDGYHDEFGIFFVTHEKTANGPTVRTFGAARAFAYNLTPFDQRVFLDEVIGVIDGTTSPADAVTRLCRAKSGNVPQSLFRRSKDSKATTRSTKRSRSRLC